MIISLNWLKKFTDINIPVDELVELIGARLVEVEDIINLGDKYKNIVITKVVESNKMPDSDHLSIVKLDDGGMVSEIERDENGYVQVVCGAPNMRAGITVVWLPPKTIVPSTYKTAEEFVLDSRNLRGVMSNGMVASAKELDLSDDHTGIVEIIEEVNPGTLFVDAYELDDYLLYIENKSLTHRPDCFGVIGFAREVSAILGQKFETPQWMDDTLSYPDDISDDVNLNVVIDNPELSPRYLALVLDNLSPAVKSPMLIQTYLSRVGVRPINAVVDVTNYLMLLSGQPLHAFDYDKLIKVCGDNEEIHVRAGRGGEKLELLDGKTIELTTSDIVIAAGETAVALAGAMGGKSTAIDENTTRIVIESASFNLYNLRGTQMRHGIFSEAITRFTKGQPAELALPVICRATEMMIELTSARKISNIIEAYPGKSKYQRLNVELENINDVLGTKYSKNDVLNILQRVEFDVVSENADTISVAAPYWRNDIEIAEDLAEEVGRIGGFDNIISNLPKREFTAIKPSEYDTFRNKLRKILKEAGANEVLTYSFVHGDIMKKAGQDVSNSYRLVNSISPDLQYCRQSLTPSLLNVAYMNIKQGFDRFAVYEINKAHQKSDGLNIESVPLEKDLLALTFSDKAIHSETPYYQAKKFLDYITDSLGVDVIYQNISGDEQDSIFAPFEIKRSAKVIDKNTSKLVGVVGEYKASVIGGFKLPKYTSGFEIDLTTLFGLSNDAGIKYKPLSRYPSTERDICFKVNDNIQYSQIIDLANLAKIGDGLSIAVSPVDIFKAEGSDTKNITIRVKLTSYDHTLTGEEVSLVVKNICAAVAHETNAVII